MALNQLDIHRGKIWLNSTWYIEINSIRIIEKQNKASKRRGEYFHNHSISNYFSNKTQRAQITKKISDKLDYLKLRTSFIKRSP